MDFRFRRKKGRTTDITATTEFDSEAVIRSSCGFTGGGLGSFILGVINVLIGLLLSSPTTAALACRRYSGPQHPAGHCRPWPCAGRFTKR
jgi:hypothetical protein